MKTKYENICETNQLNQPMHYESGDFETFFRKNQRESCPLRGFEVNASEEVNAPEILMKLRRWPLAVVYIYMCIYVYIYIYCT